MDARHVVAIGSVALCLLIATRRLFPTTPRSIARHYFSAFSAAAAIGLIGELAQQMSGRDAEVGDPVRDLTS